MPLVVRVERLFRPLLAVLLCAAAAGCAKSDFSGGGGKAAAGTVKKPAVDEAGARPPKQEHDLDGKPAAPDCPKQEQTVLVVDLRSGWWAGDGGAFFHSLLDGLGKPCQATLAFEYHHVTESMHEFALYAEGRIVESGGRAGPREGAFARQAFREYEQIWVLSGSRDDEDDVRIESPVFQGLLEGLTGSRAGVFVGGGFGAVYHVSAILEALGVDATMTTSQAQDAIVELDGRPARATSRLVVEAGAKSHPIFSGGRASIADSVDGGGDPMASDALSGSVKILARSSGGEPVIAEATAGGRTVLLDAGLQRYYVVTDKEGGAQTLALLQGIARYLGAP